MKRARILFFASLVVAIMTCDGQFSSRSRHEFEGEKRFTHVRNCLNAVMHSEQSNQHFFLIADEINNYKLNVTIFPLRWPKTIASNWTIISAARQPRGIILLFPDTNTTNYPIFLKSMAAQFHLKYVVFTESVRYIFLMMELFWKFKILNVVVLYHSESEAIHVLTYTPFTKRGCDTDLPLRINKWLDDSNRFETEEYLFSKRWKVYNFHGCPVRASMQSSSFDVAPHANNPDDMALRLFRFFERRMNFTGITTDGENSLDSYTLAYSNSSNRDILSLVGDEVDVALGKFSMLMPLGDNIVGPLQHSMDCFTWAVPLQAGRRPSMWTTYAFEFDQYTWMVIIGLMCLATGFFAALCRLELNQNDLFSRSFNTFTSLSFLLGITVQTKPKNDSLRVFYVAIVLFCFVTNAAYQATMGSLVTVPPDSLNLGSTNELLGTDIVLTGNPRMFYLLLASNQSSKSAHDVLERFQTINPGELLKVLRKVQTGRKHAVLHRADVLEELEHLINNKGNDSDPYYIIPNCMFSAFNAPFLLKSGSLLMDPFVTLGNSLIESGIVLKWEKVRQRMDELLHVNYTSYEEKVRKYSVKQLTGGLIILASGCAISLAVFLAEILSKGFMYKNVNSNNDSKKQEY